MTRSETTALKELRDKIDSLESDVLQRMTVVETEQKTLKVTAERTSRQVGEMHDLLMKARGARWAILTLIAVTSMLAGLLGWLANRWHQIVPTLSN